AEEENILRARTWAIRSRLVRNDLLSDSTLRRIHKEMFGAVWRWAGVYRRSDKNIGGPWSQVPALVRQVCENFALRVSLAGEDRDRLCVEFHYHIVNIHPFVNGNGRHARFCADRLVENLGGRPFPWGRDALGGEGAARQSYLAGLHAADAGDLALLVRFARSGAKREASDMSIDK
ncbi:MAG TPA: mobile mystery protein B, partial [Gemmatimonadaceae bacterium]|nr:mobile mystery protein B [Gemmatimonadaceae bacterium]